MPHTLDATTVRTWCGLALEALGQAREGIDAINVYPVADGDTGTNLYLTLESAAQAVDAVFAAHAAVADEEGPALPDAVRAMAHGALIGARGNSGTILAQLLRGMAEVLAAAASEGGAPSARSAVSAPSTARSASSAVDAELLRRALRRAAESAYEAVAHPVEGTVLTVAGAAADAGERAVGGAADVARAAYEGACAALDATPAQLDVLASAGVVDAGGCGLVTVLGSLVEAVTGETAMGPIGAVPAPYGGTASRHPTAAGSRLPAGAGSAEASSRCGDTAAAPAGDRHATAAAPAPRRAEAAGPGRAEAAGRGRADAASGSADAAAGLPGPTGPTARGAVGAAAREPGTRPDAASARSPVSGLADGGSAEESASAVAAPALLDGEQVTGPPGKGPDAAFGVPGGGSAGAEAASSEGCSAAASSGTGDARRPVVHDTDAASGRPGEGTSLWPAAPEEQAPAGSACAPPAVGADAAASVPQGRPDEAPGAVSGHPGEGARPGPAYEVIYLLEASDDAVAGLRERLDVLGDSLVVVGGDGLWNVHVHVDDAGAAVEAGVDAGRPYRIRITHFGAAAMAPESAPGPPGASGAPREEHERVQRAVVAVVPGEGLAGLCREAGATVVTARPGEPPASGELVEAIRRAHAREVVLLPNDPALRHTAAAAVEQARAEGVRVALIPTRSSVQGIAALAVHEPDRRFDEDVVAMTSAAGATRYGELAVAERQSWTTAGVCEAGDVLGLIDGDVAVIGADLFGTATTVLDRMLAAGGELVTLVLGSGIPDDLGERLEAHVRDAHLAVDTVVYRGGQPSVPLLMGVE
ncbi:DAK2 domain-containing protein [Streptomyces sp. 7N604]|uniref:DAK2 domain-containing protein n=1 Tax=Streptomyces sp. 7N604 TaxID=3457415 RepID=UPI003FD14B30